jgi:hypothetical protein
MSASVTDLSRDPLPRKSQSSAERMQRYRKRQRRGQRIIRMQIGHVEIAALISMGFVAAGDREDVTAIECGLGSFIDQTLLGL